jgi:RNA polymerase sigma factor (sigma-70 family)
MDEIAQLIKTICSGTPREQSRAMESLYAQQQRPLRRRFMAIYRLSHEQADDLVQELMMRILNTACSFTGTGGAALGWIHKLGFHLFVDNYRRAAKEPIVQPIPEDENGMMQFEEPAERDSTDEHALLDLVEQAMAQMRESNPKLAVAIEASVLEGWDGKTLAEFLGKKSVGAAYQTVYEARLKLREIARRLLGVGKTR